MGYLVVFFSGPFPLFVAHLVVPLAVSFSVVGVSFAPSALLLRATVLGIRGHDSVKT